MNAIAYIRVSMLDQAQSGAGLEAQRQAIAAEATVTRLRERVAGVRSARAAKSAPTKEKPPDKTIEELRARRGR